MILDYFQGPDNARATLDDIVSHTIEAEANTLAVERESIGIDVARVHTPMLAELDLLKCDLTRETVWYRRNSELEKFMET